MEVVIIRAVLYIGPVVKQFQQLMGWDQQRHTLPGEYPQ